MRRLPVLALLAAALLPSAPSASAACSRSVQAPSVWTVGGVSNAGPYVQSCGTTCTQVVAVGGVSQPGVVALGPSYVNLCT